LGYRPGRTAQEAVQRVAEAIGKHQTRVIDIDIDRRAYFDNVRQDLRLAKVARRVSDADVRHLRKMMHKASGAKGVPQGGVISPLLRNRYLNEVDPLLEQAQETTRNGRYTYLEYARYADDLVIRVDAYPRQDGLLRAADQRLREELAKLHVEINEEKSRVVDLGQGGRFGFLGLEFRRIRRLRGVWRPEYVPKLTKRTALLQKLRDIFRRFPSPPVGRVVELINPIRRGGVNYFAVGPSRRCFGFVRDWVAKQIRRHLRRARGRPGFGWARWSRRWRSDRLGLFNDYRVRRPSASPTALPVP
jgi:RNA-directed DNA polymerase